MNRTFIVSLSLLAALIDAPFARSDFVFSTRRSSVGADAFAGDVNDFQSNTVFNEYGSFDGSVMATADGAGTALGAATAQQSSNINIDPVTGVVTITASAETHGSVA
ncbi:MAG: hypothetical protein WD229_12360, partial [Pirellulales bacterium]